MSSIDLRPLIARYPLRSSLIVSFGVSIPFFPLVFLANQGPRWMVQNFVWVVVTVLGGGAFASAAAFRVALKYRDELCPPDLSRSMPRAIGVNSFDDRVSWARSDHVLGAANRVVGSTFEAARTYPIRAQFVCLVLLALIYAGRRTSGVLGFVLMIVSGALMIGIVALILVLLIARRPTNAERE